MQHRKCCGWEGGKTQMLIRLALWAEHWTQQALHQDQNLCTKIARVHQTSQILLLEMPIRKSSTIQKNHTQDKASILPSTQAIVDGWTIQGTIWAKENIIIDHLAKVKEGFSFYVFIRSDSLLNLFSLPLIDLRCEFGKPEVHLSKR